MANEDSYESPLIPPEERGFRPFIWKVKPLARLPGLTTTQSPDSVAHVPLSKITNFLESEKIITKLGTLGSLSDENFISHPQYEGNRTLLRSTYLDHNQSSYAQAIYKTPSTETSVEQCLCDKNVKSFSFGYICPKTGKLIPKMSSPLPFPRLDYAGFQAFSSDAKASMLKPTDNICPFCINPSEGCLCYQTSFIPRGTWDFPTGPTFLQYELDTPEYLVSNICNSKPEQDSPQVYPMDLHPSTSIGFSLSYPKIPFDLVPIQSPICLQEPTHMIPIPQHPDSPQPIIKVKAIEKVKMVTSIDNFKIILLGLIGLICLMAIIVFSTLLIQNHNRRIKEGEVIIELTIPDDGWMTDEGLHSALRFPGIVHHENHHPLVEVNTSVSEKMVPETHIYQPIIRESLIPPRFISHHEVTFISPLSLQNDEGVTLIKNGMYWSEEVISSIDPGLNQQDLNSELHFLRNRKVAKLEDPNWLHCGRDKNRFLIFEDKQHACARYRTLHRHLVLGELMSFYLARMLDITNVPAVVLSKVDTSTDTWFKVEDDVKRSGWDEGTIVAMIEWIDHLVRDRMPDVLRQALMKGTLLDVTSDKDWYDEEDTDITDITHINLRNLGLEEAALMAQWSDLTIFDYLTGNYDRVASMQDAADKENRPEIMLETVHNLVKSKTTGSLWFIDNESGILDAYNLLYPTNRIKEAMVEGARFKKMHENMLQTTCIFKKSTVDNIFSLYKNGDAASILSDFVSLNEPLYKELLADVHEKTIAFKNHFQERIGEVWEWMKICQSDVRVW